MKAISAHFVGTQQGYAHLPAIQLWTVLEQVGPHPAGSTISSRTLNQYGYEPKEADMTTIELQEVCRG